MRIFLTSLIFIFILTGCFQTPVKPENVEHPIIKTLDNYFEGRRNADIDLLKETFIETATLETIDDNGSYLPITLQDYLQTVSNQGKVEVATQVMYLSITNQIAIAQTRFDYGKVIYMDYLTLIKTTKGWKISNKAFVKM